MLTQDAKIPVGGEFYPRLIVPKRRKFQETVFIGKKYKLSIQNGNL